MGTAYGGQAHGDAADDLVGQICHHAALFSLW
jgi:hypothetical protein